MQVHQFHPKVFPGDAIGNQMVSLQQLLKTLGYTGQLFCEQPPLNLTADFKLLRQAEQLVAADDLMLLHFSAGYSSEVLSWVRQFRARKVLVYHNITPSTYFRGVNVVFEEQTLAGRQQLSYLSTVTEAGWGDSAFNYLELLTFGWKLGGVLPIVFDATRYSASPDYRTLKRLQGGFNLCFVGRVVPNKKFEDLILTFYYLKKFVRPDARLILVGSWDGMEPYLEFLKALVTLLEIPDVLFLGHVSPQELIACYKSAAIYLSMSEHEGFGVPLLESMYFGIPVVAYKAAAVPETLGRSGVLIAAKDYRRVAELIGMIGEDQNLRERIIVSQRERLESFKPDHVRELLRALLQELGI
ncbi:MAG: glycosyltransferase family 4 protein [Anaerolineales bacterium]|nr:glycosyltransferase family 4 protein [Anaerolineales bacterium]